MSKPSWQKQAVYVIMPPESFRPTSPWTWPDGFSNGELVQKNVSMTEARAYCRVFNSQQMKLGRPIERWAIAARYLRRNGRGNGNGNGVSAGQVGLAVE